MDVVKLPKKFREACYAITDGHHEALETLESFTKYPHQIAAVKAEIAYFDMDYESAIIRYLYLGENFLSDGQMLKRIREAAYINAGTLIRK